MDKYEYRMSAEQINALIEQREYGEAVKIADTIDWRRVKSVAMLCKVSELYKMNRRYEDSKEILLLAYDRQPGSRKIVYSLCELCIKLEELVLAIEYYKEFVQIAPKDTGRFILQYRLYEAQDVSLEERIAVLEEYKKRDYREKWAYELAYLYHRIGLATRCVEECDELILWFGEGKYVIKAMELKMLHAPLSPSQQEKYDQRFQRSTTAYMVNTEDGTMEEASDEDMRTASGVSSNTGSIPSMPIQIKSVEVSNAPTTRIPSRDVENEMQAAEADMNLADTKEMPTIDMPQIPLAEVSPDMDIHVKPLDMGEYNTINLQKELAKNLAKMFEQEDMEATDATRALPVDSINDLANAREAMESENASKEELPLEETLAKELPDETLAEEVTAKDSRDLSVTRAIVDEVAQIIGALHERDQITEEDLLKSIEPLENEAPEAKEEPETIAEPETAAEAEMPTAPEMVAEPETSAAPEAEQQSVPEEEPSSEEEMVNEQITGQLSFDDLMSEWEQTKKAAEDKRLEEMRRKVLEQTGPMFKNFDEAARASVQADLDMITPPLNVFEAAADVVTQDDEVEELEEVAPVLEEEPIQIAGEPAYHPTVFDTAEINGLEEKLMASLAVEEPKTEELKIEEPKIEMPQAEEPVLPQEKPGSVTEEFDKNLEQMVMQALSESEEKTPDAPKGDTGFIIADLTEEEAKKAEDAKKAAEIVERLKKRETAQLEQEAIDQAAKEQAIAEGREQDIPVRRTLTKSEKEMFGSIAQTREVQESVANAIDNISLNPCLGNVIVTGEKGTGTMTAAKNLIKTLSVNNDAFSGKVAKITGELLNSKSIEETLNNLENGALIIEHASSLDEMTLLSINEYLKKKKDGGVFIVLEDTKKGMESLLEKPNASREFFDLQIDIAALDNDGLVAYGKEYANEREYSIDDMGVLALYTRIADMQTNEHAVTVDEVREIVDEAIRKAEKKNISHFMDVILAKRYDDEDMIVLREKDFMK